MKKWRVKYYIVKQGKTPQSEEQVEAKTISEAINQVQRRHGHKPVYVTKVIKLGDLPDDAQLWTRDSGDAVIEPATTTRDAGDARKRGRTNNADMAQATHKDGREPRH